MKARSWRNGGMVANAGAKGKRLAVGAWVAIALLAGCAQDTSRLTAEMEARLQSEGIVRRADNLEFRYTRGVGTREAGWENRKASIVVTRQTVYIHKNEKVGLLIGPESRRVCSVERRGDRVRVHAGTGQSAEVWSFVPQDSAEGWARDIRVVIHSRGGVEQ
jgi:hypothetical protein